MKVGKIKKNELLRSEIKYSVNTPRKSILISNDNIIFVLSLEEALDSLMGKTIYNVVGLPVDDEIIGYNLYQNKDIDTIMNFDQVLLIVTKANNELDTLYLLIEQECLLGYKELLELEEKLKNTNCSQHFSKKFF